MLGVTYQVVLTLYLIQACFDASMKIDFEKKEKWSVCFLGAKAPLSIMLSTIKS